MDRVTSRRTLPSLVEGVLDQDTLYLDNLFAQAWEDLKLGRAMKRAGFRKRSGAVHPRSDAPAPAPG